MKITLLEWYRDFHLTFRLASDNEVLFIFCKEIPEGEPTVELNRFVPKEYEPYICEALETLYRAGRPASLKNIYQLTNTKLPEDMKPLQV